MFFFRKYSKYIDILNYFRLFMVSDREQGMFDLSKPLFGDINYVLGRLLKKNLCIVEKESDWR